MHRKTYDSTVKMMIVKVQIFIKTFFVIGMVLFSANASASYWLECIGLVTIKSDIAEITNYSEAKEKFIKADFYIHDHTFTCKGHGSKIDIKGIRKNTKISFSALINENMFKKGTHLQVEYSHVNSMLPSGGTTNVGWTVLKTVKTIPPEKISTQREKPNQIPESISEGVDLSVEESLWEKYKEALPSYKELEGSPLKNEGISDTNELFSIYRDNLFKVIDAKKYALEACKIRRSMNKYIKKFSPECKLFASNNNLLVSMTDFGLKPHKVDLIFAAQRKSLSTVKKIVDAGADIHQTNSFGNTALHKAVQEGREDVAEYLLEKGSNIHHKQERDFDALNLAAMAGDSKLFEFLVGKGADINTTAETAEKMPIHYAASGDHRKLLKSLWVLFPAPWGVIWSNEQNSDHQLAMF